MASPSFLLAAFAAVALLSSPVLAQNCRSQTLPSNAVYSNCTDLSTLSAALHWNYSSTTNPPQLSVAFTAQLPNEVGWVAWALNPTALAMVGSQAFIAFRDDTNGSIVVRTYDIQSKGPVSESRISYEVFSKRAVLSGGNITIFAVIGLPVSGSVYHVWQVGAEVDDGVPQRHAFLPENLNSVGILPVSRISPGPGPSHSHSPASAPGRSPTSAPGRSPTSGTPAAPPPRNGGYSVVKMGGWLFSALALGLSSTLL